MMRFREIEEYIEHRPQFANGFGVDRARDILKALGNPEKELKIIHIAGTNGKGSVCAYVAGILKGQGFKVGLFTSPHLVTIRERIKINEIDISERDFEYYYNCMMDKISDLPIGYFDIFFGIAMLYYKDQGVDYVVMETGLGGRLDATNAVECPICSIITTISLEHTAILGDTLEMIAREKAGIIKSNIPVVYSGCDKIVEAVIEEVAKNKKSKAILVGEKNYEIIKNQGGNIDFYINNEYYRKDSFRLSTRAIYQVENATIAITAVKALEECGYFKIDTVKLKQSVENTTWKGRMEEVASDIYVDGAHNPQGIKAFLSSVKKSFCDESLSNVKRILVFAVVSDKNFEEMVRLICESECFDAFIVTQIEGYRKLDAEVVRGVFAQYTQKEVEVYKDSVEAYRAAIQKKPARCFMTGSLYLVGTIKEQLMSINGKEE